MTSSSASATLRWTDDGIAKSCRSIWISVAGGEKHDKAACSGCDPPIRAKAGGAMVIDPLSSVLAYERAFRT
jgi:hypothetical protein